MGTHRFSIEGKEYQVNVGVRSGNHVEVSVNGRVYLVELPATAMTAAAPAAAAAPAPISAAVPAAAPAASGTGQVRAPISGVVISVDATPGKQVGAGDRLLILEAMKMENEILAPCGGVVASVAVKPQDQVGTGDLLLTITPS